MEKPRRLFFPLTGTKETGTDMTYPHKPQDPRPEKGARSAGTVATPENARREDALLEVDILDFNDDGIGVGRYGQHEVLIGGALPGERVRVAVAHRGQRRIIGALKEIVRPHPQRIPSPCRCSRRCLGCPLIALDYSEQLNFKEERVKDAMKHYPQLRNLEVRPVLPAPEPLGYRINAKLVFVKERGRVRLGLYRRGSHNVIDIGECPLHHPLVNKIVQTVREEVERQGIFVFDERRQTGLLRYLLVRVEPNNRQAMVTFVVTERNFQQLTHLGKWLQRKVPEVISVQQNINPREGNIVMGRETLRLLGVDDLIMNIGDVRLRMAPTSFVQVNPAQAASMYEITRKWLALNRKENVLDIYCGIGGIALNLAKDAGKVVGIELAEEAVRNARHNAFMNKLRNCTFRAGDAAEILEELAAEELKVTAAVLNPPRGGAEPEVLERLADLSPERLVYISCYPATLARDLAALHDLGFQALIAQPVDMFPQTPHVETVVLLDREKAKS